MSFTYIINRISNYTNQCRGHKNSNVTNDEAYLYENPQTPKHEANKQIYHHGVLIKCPFITVPTVRDVTSSPDLAI